MRTKIDTDKLNHLSTVESMFEKEYGTKGTAVREEFDAKSRAWYYSEITKAAHKSAEKPLQQSADKIGK